MAIFILNQKILTRGGDMWIEDGEGRHAYEVKGPLSTTKPHLLEDVSGNVIYEISINLDLMGRVFEIKRGTDVVARVKAATFSFMASNYTMTLADGTEIPIKGNFGKREFRATLNGKDAFVTSRKLVSVRESYGIDISPDIETPLALAALVAIEQMERQV